jgi:hypothetical protein
LWKDAKRYLAMPAAIECTVTFPIENRMFGVDSLAKRLNALVSDGQISDWHPGRWIDWDHTAIEINFDSIVDATIAKKLCFDGTARLPSRLEEENNGSERPHTPVVVSTSIG